MTLRQHPLYHSAKGLVFDNQEEFDPKLSPDRRASFFLSKYQETIDPFTRYPKYFTGSYGNTATILRSIKLYYKKLVCSSEISEREYVVLLDTMFSSRIIMSEKSVRATLERTNQKSSDKSKKRRSKL